MASLRIAPTKAARALNLLRTVQYTHPPNCPCHSNPGHHHHAAKSKSAASQARRALATPVDTSRQKEYAFQMAASNIRFGPGSTREVGMDFKNMGAKKVMIVTDTTVAQLDAMKNSVEALDSEGIEYVVYSATKVEPKDTSIKEAIAFAKQHKPDAFLAVGGGSVIDTAKLMNLYTAYPGTISHAFCG